MDVASVLTVVAPIGLFEPADSRIGGQAHDCYLVAHAQVCDALSGESSTATTG
ncbi:MAG: hypothetical protein IT305_10435 [Chloroflexi bacterium]|nr:hypothetical protein [Chloroflexota bacterium]